jgi:DNA-binding CsgD family transcriptional regulator
VLGRAIGIRRKGAVIFMASLAVFFFAALHDILVFHHVILAPYILHFGFLGFIVIQTFLVAYFYSKSKGNISTLIEKLHTTKRELQELKESSVPETLDIFPFCHKFDITSREKDVVELIVSGASNNEIAEKLFISFHTVRRHLNNIYRKCNISERNELLVLIKEISIKKELL